MRRAELSVAQDTKKPGLQESVGAASGSRMSWERLGMSWTLGCVAQKLRNWASVEEVPALDASASNKAGASSQCSHSQSKETL